MTNVSIYVEPVFSMRVDERGDRLELILGDFWQPDVLHERPRDLAIQAAPAAEINEHVHQDIEEDPLPGGSRRRTREDEEEENSSKRLRGDMEEFGYSDPDSSCRSWTSDVGDEDTDEDDGMKVYHHITEEEPPAPRLRDEKRRDGDEGDSRNTNSDRHVSAPSVSREQQAGGCNDGSWHPPADRPGVGIPL